LDVPKRLFFKERKKQCRLKRRLLRKRLQPMLCLVFKAFLPGYESVCVLLLEGVLSQLRDPVYIIQTTSVQTLARRLQRFINKHGQATKQSSNEECAIFRTRSLGCQLAWTIYVITS
jgi:hypothetical protein